MGTWDELGDRTCCVGRTGEDWGSGDGGVRMTTGKLDGIRDCVVVRHVVGVEAAQSIDPVRSCGMTKTLKR